LIYYVTVEYVGDVAIYVSSYKVSRFEEVRGKIQDAVFNVVRQVYSARDDADQARPLYNKVVIVGHSLGTVIAYDMLNAAISWDQAEKNNSMDVVGRTSALITFGSPLDKTAFLFRTQVSGPKFLREALAAQRQPLIMNYKEYRPLDTFHWTNIYSRMDIVSGCLAYYDTPEESAPVTAAKKTEMEAAPKKPDADSAPEQFRNPVINVVDPAAWIPLLAHVQYWNDQKLRDELYGAIR
jgi:pimeloyl-ACP methyl ester carboxylesterase